jgi:rhamnose transport system substrate-binding protein
MRPTTARLRAATHRSTSRAALDEKERGHMRPHKLMAVMLSLALVGAVACGDDDDDTEAGTSGEEGSEGGGAAGEAVTIEAGDDMNAILLPKCTGIAVFDQANEGAQEAAEELGTSEPEFLGPSTCEDPTGQIETMTNAATQGVDAVMISNNAGEQIQSGVDAATDADVSVVSWDSPIPSGEGESLFVAQVDFDETGVVMADMALEILGDDGGQFAILSASPDAANQNAWIAALEEALQDEKYANLELVDTVYGNDDSDESYNQALGLIDSHPDLELIMAPTTVGIAAAGKAMTDEGLCDQVKVSGLGLPEEMREYTQSHSSPCGASSTSATSPTTRPTGSPPVRSRLPRVRHSPPAAWVSTRSRRTPHATTACAS